VCDTYGMPSSHTQAIAYCLAAYIVSRLWFSRSRQTSHLQRMLTTAEGTGLGVLMVTVGYARVYLGYHTPLQVAMGGLTGMIFGALWSRGCLAMVRRHGPSIKERLPFLEALGFRAEGGIFTRKSHPEKMG